MEQKVRFQMRISEKTDQAVKAAIPLANCRSQNEFVEKALLHYAREIIRGLQRFAREHGDHIRMYHRLTTASGDQAEALARGIEGMTARLYTDFITRGQQAGDLRGDMNPRCFAFFFDNLLMMLQFSYCCDYYRARRSLYLGEAAGEDSVVEEELLKFLESAFTFEQSAISHREREKEGET